MVKMKFQWFFDISTVKDTMQIITVSAGGEIVKQRLAPFFSAYKYWKMGSVQLKMIPASTLPVDPNGLSIEAGDNLVDPRDQLSPGLTRITNGEDFFEDLTGVSADVQRKIYNTMLLDRRWFKFALQSGLKRSAVPLYWQIGQLHQDYFPGSTTNVPQLSELMDEIASVASKYENVNEAVSAVLNSYLGENSDPRGIFQTGHKGRLDWMPTDALIHTRIDTGDVEMPAETQVPEIECYKIILPPAYKTKYWYRCYVTETVFFKEPIVNNLVGDESDLAYSSLDRFIRASFPTPAEPTEGKSIPFTYPNPDNDGRDF